MGGDLEQPTLEAATGFLAPGQILGNRYRIRSELGRGGMGEVWRAFDLKLRVDVAVKSLRDELLSHERALETLRQEVRVAREVISPNVCRVFDLLEIEGRELVSMEYIDGTTLVHVLAERSPLDLEETREIALQFLAGLEAIHQAGLVHRDIKPENVMITRSGRVVVMDFGIAKGLAAEGTETVAGTPAYMAPEQERGEGVNARADVFSAGVLLAEMMAPEGVRDRELRQAVWRGVREDPPRLSESPWQSVLERAVARSPDERYASAAKLSRALEEVALRVEGAEDVTPYPGLAAFTEEDAGYFFGRELEVEAMWKKLRRPHLLALIGQSGAGKSSFLRAGLLASKPEGWGHVVLTPGSAPLASLRESLVAEMSGDTEAMLELVRGQDADTLVSAVSRWRQRHKMALVIIDQFEELFTLNPAEVQSELAELLERLVLEADVHVLLSMRDDFLFHCSDQPALAPILSELTLLRSPTGSALRRALVQPALKCGYHFEDEELVDEMVAEVSEERGALPLVAFAAAALWERRDREAGLLTREAYEEIGGVAGALAQHADATLEGIGSERVPIVRELFRNLVTARGTRAARQREELLSVFAEGDREAAVEVLDALVDARLLTSYELPAEEGEEDLHGHQRIEIIHESLLSAWPRLVRWQTQDADGVQLRDQLRQAAQTWEERDRSDDLLWTGSAFREFELWRDRYPGGLSETEERFEAAMTTLATRRQRRRRVALATVLSVLLGVVGVVGVLWRQAESARRASEAARLLGLGRLETEHNPSGAVAYALASLEIVDDLDTRTFALETLWRGPTALRTTDWCYAHGIGFSPDGMWLAVACKEGIRFWSRSGGESRTLGGPEDELPFPARVVFARGSSLVATACVKHESIHVWSIPDGEVVRSIEIDGERMDDWNISADGTEIVTVRESGGSLLVQSWPLPEGEPAVLGRTEKSDHSYGSREWRVRHDGYSIYGRSLEALQAPERLLGWHDEGVTTISFSPDGRWMASGDRSGEVRVWPLAAQPDSPLRTLASEDGSAIRALAFDSTSRRLAVAALGPTRIWDLGGPPGADPLVLTSSGLQVNVVAFHPNDDWVVTAGTGLRIWPLARPYSRVLRGHTSQTIGVDFAADGSWIASSSSDRTIRRWPLTRVEAVTNPVLYENPRMSVLGIAIDPGGRFVLAGIAGNEGTWLVPLGQDEPRRLEGFEEQAWHVALSSDGRFAAAADGLFNRADGVIRVWDLEAGGVRVLDPGEGNRGNTQHLDFTPENRLVSGGEGSVRVWNLEDGTFEILREGKGEFRWVDSGLSPDGRFLASFTHGDEHPFIHDLESGDSWELPPHGQAHEFAFDRAGEMLVSAGAHLPAFFDGEPESHLRAGPVTGGEAHLLLGHEGVVYGIAVSPDGHWIGSVGEDKTVRLWPRPKGDPFHTLPYEKLLDRLRALTNLRAVRDGEVQGGYRLEAGPFPGWETAPTW